MLTEVIWYRVEDGELQQLEDSEDYEFTRDHNKHGATVFNTAKSMAGQLMCMVLNEKGHCSQSFILKVRSKSSMPLENELSLVQLDAASECELQIT